MSSSGQAPNVSMDDLLASIKSMIEGESSGEANSQVGANLESAPGMTPQGADAPNNALDDGIMDLTQVVSAPQQQAQAQQPQSQQQGGLDPAAAPPNPVSNPAQDLGGINPLLQGQEQQGQAAEMNAGPLNAGQMGAQEQVADMSVGQSAQDAAAKLDDIFSGMDGDAGLNNMGGDIGLPASQMPDSSAGLSQADPLNSNPPLDSNPQFNSNPMARGLGEAGETPAQAQMQNDLQAGAPQGNPLQDQASLADQLAGVTEGMASEGMDVSAGAEQPVVPLDQGEPQFSGALEGKAPPQSGVPHPGFAADPETPGLDSAMISAAQGQQPAGEQPQAELNPQMDGVQPLAGSNSGEPQRTELMGGHDPRLEHDIALGQALSQADASLNLSNVQGVDDTANQKMQQQSENNQANPQQMPQQAQMRGLQQAGQQMGQQGQQPHVGQMPAHAQMGGQLGQVPVPQGMQAQQGQVQQGQMVQHGHHTPQGHMAPQAQMGQQPGQMVPQGYMGAPQQMGMPQMGGPQVGSPQGGADMLPVPSGFRPVLPAVHGQGDAPIPGAMGDQLPVEMKNNLEEIVKQLLKPLLRDWLERNLPELLKGVVDEETGKIDPNKW